MSVWFTSDLHLGNNKMASTRGFISSEEHDWMLTETINEYVKKNAKLYILGDVADSTKGLKWLSSIRCSNIELVLGNHDEFTMATYLKYVQKITGFKRYKDYWLSHCPIHPHEMREKTGNIHGHTHIWGDTEKITDSRYLCVNPEYHKLKPISFYEIERRFSKL